MTETCFICKKEFLQPLLKSETFPARYHLLTDESPNNTRLESILHDIVADEGIKDALIQTSVVCQICFNLLCEFESTHSRLLEIQEKIRGCIDTSRHDITHSQSEENGKRNKKRIFERVISENKQEPQVREHLEEVVLDEEQEVNGWDEDERIVQLLNKSASTCSWTMTRTENKSTAPRPSLKGVIRAKCLYPSCDMSARVQLVSEQEKRIRIIFNGSDPDHSVPPNKLRTLYEMNRQAWTDSFTCDYCTKVESSDLTLNVHLQSSHSSSHLFTCPICHRTFRRFQARNNHVLTMHCSDAPYKCTSCHKRFKVRSKQIEHEKCCVLGHRFPCRECGLSLQNKRNLMDHQNVFHAKHNVKKHQCKECNKKFYKESNLKSHMVTHRSERSFTCRECEKQFKRAKSLKHHIQITHEGKRPFHLCVYCGRGFESQSGLKNHMSIHTGEEYIKRTVSCSVCQKSFRCESDLKIHMVVHTKEKPFNCDICGLRFTQKASMKDHYNVHLNRFQCKLCKKSFGRQRYLDCHAKSCGQVKQQESKDIIEIVQEGTKSIRIETVPVIEAIETIPIAESEKEEQISTVLAHFNRQGTITMLQYDTTDV